MWRARRLWFTRSRGAAEGSSPGRDAYSGAALLAIHDPKGSGSLLLPFSPRVRANREQ
jgi:hypothetical protein